MLKKKNRTVPFYRLLSLLFGLFMFSGTSQALVVVQYHHISNTTPESTSLSPELFEQHLQYLALNKFKVLDFKTVMAYLKQGRHFPPKSILITFDDGYSSIYHTAFPLLRKYKFPFTVFVNTQPIEKELEQFMSWKELQAIIDYGGAVANHSISHPHMIKKSLSESSRQQAKLNRYELLEAERSLKNQLSEVHKAFAYPYGEYDSSVKALLRELGYIGFGQHSGAVSENPDLQAIPRFPFGGRFGSLEDFKLKVNSLPLEIKKTLLLDKHGKRLMSYLIPNKVAELKLLLVLAEKHRTLKVECFSSDGNKLEYVAVDDGLLFTMTGGIPVGRSRINCTAASSRKDQFHWYSQPLIKANSSENYY